MRDKTCDAKCKRKKRAKAATKKDNPFPKKLFSPNRPSYFFQEPVIYREIRAQKIANFAQDIDRSPFGVPNTYQMTNYKNIGPTKVNIHDLMEDIELRDRLLERGVENVDELIALAQTTRQQAREKMAEKK